MSLCLRSRLLLILLALAALPVSAQEKDTADGWKNPYHERTTWRVWRDDQTPVTADTLTGREKKEKRETKQFAPLPEAERLYPADAKKGGPFLVWVKGKPSKRYAGMWDDVYASWSGLHGYVRPSWMGRAKQNSGEVKSQIMHLVDLDRARNHSKLGINFYHQSTTGMGHTLANGRGQQLDRMYFASGLICSPAHASYTEKATHTHDLYIAQHPCFFNSVGSSNSETMAITKMIIVGAHLRPELKARLKRHGLYPAALLAIWKASLPYRVPYGHELRHKIAYNAVGQRSLYPTRYGFAGSNRGDAGSWGHRYDDTEHMRRMVAMARALTSPPPVALLSDVTVSSGQQVYATHKCVAVIQKPGEAVELSLSTARSYDLDGRPLQLRWRLLHGEPGVTLTTDDSGRVTIKAPWNDRLPEGRTSLALIAEGPDGVCGNPAIVNIYRKRHDKPLPSGAGYKDYTYETAHWNQRPVLLDGQALVCTRRDASLRLQAFDPEGFPLRWRLGGKGTDAPGELTLDGNLLTWTPGRRAKPGDYQAHLVASDGCGGNSYGGVYLTLRYKPSLHAQISASALEGVAPLKASFERKQSVASRRAQFGWYTGDPAKLPKKGLEGFKSGRKFRHTFDKPGLYTVVLRVIDGKATQDARVKLRVLEKAAGEGKLELLGLGARVASGGAPDALRGTALKVAAGQERVVELLVCNTGGEAVDLGKKPAELSGEHAKDWELTDVPTGKLEPGESRWLRLTVKSKDKGARAATCTLSAKGAADVVVKLSAVVE